jgi:hypothetical protein
MASIFVLYMLVSHQWIIELSSKYLSHLILISRDFHPLVLSDNLNRCGVDWMYLLQA